MPDSAASKKNPVVILNMHYTGLGIARNLRELGVPMYAISGDKTLCGNATKYCRFLHGPDTEHEPERCAEFLLTLAQSVEPNAVLLPTRDHDIHFINRYRDALDERFIVPYPPTSVVKTVVDKSAVVKAATQAGISCPRNVIVEKLQDIELVREQLSLPVIAKPVIASEWRKKGVWEAVGKRKAVILETYDAVKQLYEAVAGLCSTMDVQEYVAGSDSNLVILGSFYSAGTDEFSYFTGRKLLQYPAGSGTGAVTQSEVIGDIVEPSRKLLDALHYRGVSEIEYKYDENTQQYRFIEINPRHWDQHRLGTSVGLNLTRKLYLHAIGAPEETRDEQRPECVRWVAEDSCLLSLLSNLKHRHYPWRTYLDILLGRKTYAVFDRRDLKPFWSLLRHTLKQYTGIFGRKMRLPYRRATE